MKAIILIPTGWRRLRSGTQLKADDRRLCSRPIRWQNIGPSYHDQGYGCAYADPYIRRIQSTKAETDPLGVVKKAIRTGNVNSVLGKHSLRFTTKSDNGSRNSWRWMNEAECAYYERWQTKRLVKGHPPYVS